MLRLTITRMALVLFSEESPFGNEVALIVTGSVRAVSKNLQIILSSPRDPQTIFALVLALAIGRLASGAMQRRPAL